MSFFGRPPRAKLLAAVLSCAAFCVSVTPIAAASLTLAAEHQDAHLATVTSPVFSSIVATGIVIGCCAGVIAMSQRHRLALQRPDTAVLASATPTVPLSAGSVWGVGN